MNRQWKLGDDLHQNDTVFDAIDFENIILMMQCNEKVKDEEAVWRCFNEIIDSRMMDAKFLVENNIEEIIKASK